MQPANVRLQRIMDLLHLGFKLDLDAGAYRILHRGQKRGWGFSVTFEVMQYWSVGAWEHSLDVIKDNMMEVESWVG
jgi:hypothetical protein